MCIKSGRRRLYLVMRTNAPRRNGLPPWAEPTGLERRSVAVLFADITGFTRLVETVDPETVYEVVRPLMDRLVRQVRIHSGDIQQILGDGFMAVFGLDSMDGDEAERAIRAGLALVSAGGDASPPVHVGIEYGEVLVTPSWAPAGFAVWGRAVNRAKRLCDIAGPGEVRIGPGAFQRAGRGMRSARSAPARLKGISGAMLSHTITAGDPIPQPLAA
jgi:class 3 adenylate cyclase